jgi:dTDP-glucose 4,6-dehydratase
MLKKILITGANGLIGHHLVDHILVNTDWQVYCLYNKSIEKITNSKHYSDNKGRVFLYQKDLSKEFTEEEVKSFNDVNFIVNLASESHIEKSIEGPKNFINNNIQIILNVLEFSRKINVEKLIQFSSDEVYGPIDGKPHIEWSNIVPTNPYSGSKAAQDCLAIAYWKTYNIPLIITNSMAVFGQGQSDEKYLPKIIKTIISGNKLTVHSNNGEIGLRSYVHARNVSSAVLFILNNVDVSYAYNNKLPERFNISGGYKFNNLEFAKLVADILQLPLNYEIVDVNLTRPNHDKEYGLDNGKLKNLGFKYPVRFYESLSSTVKDIYNLYRTDGV